MKVSYFVLTIAVLLLTTASFLTVPGRCDEKNIYKSLDTFCDVISIIQRDYIDEIGSDTLMQNAIRGMLSSLDDYSHLITSESLKKSDLQEQQEVEVLTTYGLEVAYKDGLLTVVSPVEQGPAWKAGIKAGDKIIQINEEQVNEHPLGEMLMHFRKKATEKLNLKLLRRGERDLLDIELVPGKIEGPSAGITEADEHIGLLRINRFDSDTVSKIKRAIDAMRGKGVDSMIIDVRNCPAGDIDAAIKAGEVFLPSGAVITSLEGRNEKINREFKSKQKPQFGSGPIVVIVNEGTSGAAEVFAGALRDSRKALLMGRNSFGSAFEEGVFPLENGSSISILTGVYKTPSGEIIQDKGLEVDIDIPLAEVKFAEETDEDAGTAAKKKEDTGGEEPDQKDEMLQRAIDLIKAIRLTAQR
jgi:carboxyl-terminal processing protease